MNNAQTKIYYIVEGFENIKYELYTDALNKALLHYTNAVSRIRKVVEN